MSLWTANEIAAITRGDFPGVDAAINGISIDTRTLQPGDLYISLIGENFDGNDFAHDAIAKGAVAAITTKNDHPQFITVIDTMNALQELGKAARARSSAAIIAVTGSVGKTSVKSMLAQAFSALGKTHSSDGSFNNHWGVPLSLARMPKDAEYGIFEIGMNHANEIAPLSQMVEPHVAIITTIASAHIQYLGSIENIALAKAEIFQGMNADGIAILPRDSEQFEILFAEARKQGLNKVFSFGQSKDAEIQLISFENGKITARLKNKEIGFDFGMPGIHQAVNALSVIAAIDGLKKDTAKSLKAFAEMKPVAGRGDHQEIVLNDKNNPLIIINEAYNASPIAVKAALKVLQSTPSKNRHIVILGDMRELGPDGPEFHAELSEAVLEAKPDLILLCGELMENLAKKLPAEITHYFSDSKVLSEQIADFVQSGDVLLIKGSNGSKMRLVIEALIDLSDKLGQGKTQQKASSPTG